MHQITPAHLTAVTTWFEDNFRQREELGASVSIWQNGVELLSLAHGHADRAHTRPWTQETLVPVFSSTKAPAALCALLALDQARLALDCPVAEIWPAFAQNGKAEVTFAQLLSHTGGLCALDEVVSITDYAAVIAALEKQTPLWSPGTQQGYHARTFGFLLEEIVRRLTDAASLGEYFFQNLGLPLDLDFWIGLPMEHGPRVASVYPGKLRPGVGDPVFLKAFGTRGTLTQRTFVSPAGLNAMSEFNTPEVWSAGYASMGGVGSARGLGQFYAMLAQGGEWLGRRFVPPSVLQALTQSLSDREDLVLLTPLAFAAGVMQDPQLPSGGKRRQHFGTSTRAFGHPGAGGSFAFADPDNHIAFAYVMNQMELGTLPGPKVLGMVDALYKTYG